MLSRRDFIKLMGAGIATLVVPKWIDAQADDIADEQLEPLSDEIWYSSGDKPAYWGEPDESLGQFDEVVGISNRLEDDVGILVVVSACEIAYSEDMGATWIVCDGPPSDAEMCCICILADGTWWIGMSDGTIWITPDKGRTWEHKVIEPTYRVWSVPEDCETIQGAITDASAGDTVFVGPGDYEENIILEDGVKICGGNS